MTETSYIDRVYGQERFIGQHATRKALDPIREWYHKAMACEADANDLAPLIFTTEELER